jgi:hypothetical protein
MTTTLSNHGPSARPVDGFEEDPYAGDHPDEARLRGLSRLSQCRRTVDSASVSIRDASASTLTTVHALEQARGHPAADCEHGRSRALCAPGLT